MKPDSLLYANATSLYPTHFIRAVELIMDARDHYKVPSENWPHPTRFRFGSPCERYYSEIWIDGMDWQPSYWVIEEKNLERPEIYPFIIFDDDRERELFNDYDFDQLIKGAMYYRRDKYWINHNDLGVHTDMTWPYLKRVGNVCKHECMYKYSYSHASQRPIEFLMNFDFIPEEYREENRHRGNPKPKYICSI